MPLRVAGDQVRVVEVVAAVHAHALGQAPAHGDFLRVVEQRDLDAVHLRRVVGDNAQAHIHGGRVIAVTPVTREGRVEHFA